MIAIDCEKDAAGTEITELVKELGPCPFVKTGTTGEFVYLKFDPAVLSECAST